MPCIRKSRIGARPSSVAGAANKSQARRTGGSARPVTMAGASATVRNLGKVYSETPWISSMAYSHRLPEPVVKMAGRNVISQQQGTLY